MASTRGRRKVLRCSSTVGDRSSANQTVAKLLRAGATVSYISMDEPLWFGHYYSDKNACRSSIDNLAERTHASEVHRVPIR